MSYSRKTSNKNIKNLENKRILSEEDIRITFSANIQHSANTPNEPYTQNSYNMNDNTINPSNDTAMDIEETSSSHALSWGENDISSGLFRIFEFERTDYNKHKRYGHRGTSPTT